MPSITINSMQLANVENLLKDIKNGATKALVTAINKTAKTTSVQIAKVVGQELNLKASRIKEDIKVDSANYTKLSGKVTISSEPVGLINFKTSVTKIGTKVKIFKGQGIVMKRGAFPAVVKKKGNREHLLRRHYYTGTKRPTFSNKKRYGKIPGKYRFKTYRMTGPRVYDIYMQTRHQEKVERDAAELLQKNFEKQVDEILRRNAL